MALHNLDAKAVKGDSKNAYEIGSLDSHCVKSICVFYNFAERHALQKNAKS